MNIRQAGTILALHSLPMTAENACKLMGCDCSHGPHQHATWCRSHNPDNFGERNLHKVINAR